MLKIQKVLKNELSSFINLLLTDCDIVIKETGTRLPKEKLENILFSYLGLDNEITNKSKNKINNTYKKSDELKVDVIVKKNSDVVGKKILIEDSFYWEKDNFIYDNSNIKVGYITKDGGKILTDDPFELGLIDFC